MRAKALLFCIRESKLCLGKHVVQLVTSSVLVLRYPSISCTLPVDVRIRRGKVMIDLGVTVRVAVGIAPKLEVAL